MFDWVKKLMAGDQSVTPPGEVTRDEQGRITQVRQTLSADDTKDASPHPKLVLPDSLKQRFSAANAALNDKNIILARTYGIGQEVNFSYDQDDGKLVLLFKNGTQIITNGQVLGSFDPRDRSFMWGWANPSFQDEYKTDAEAVKAEGERLGEPCLTTPIQAVTFDDIAQLLALAVEASGADGVYRCMVNGSTSMFMSFRVERILNKKGLEISVDDLFRKPPTAEIEAAATALVTRHHADMFPLDKAFQAAKDAGMNVFEGLLSETVEKKTAIYLRDWSRSDDYWLPSSAGWPSDHDPKAYKHRFNAPHMQGGVLDIALKKMAGKTVYRIKMVDGEPKITDQLLEWGEGFIWPSAD